MTQELSQGRQHPGDHAASRVRRLKALAQRPQDDAALAEVADRGHALGGVAAQATQCVGVADGLAGRDRRAVHRSVAPGRQGPDEARSRDPPGKVIDPATVDIEWKR
jgi:hypothetical protein